MGRSRNEERQKGLVGCLVVHAAVSELSEAYLFGGLDHDVWTGIEKVERKLAKLKEPFRGIKPRNPKDYEARRNTP